MDDVPSKRVNRRNAMLRSNAALRLRMARSGPLTQSTATPPGEMQSALFRETTGPTEVASDQLPAGTQPLPNVLNTPDWLLQPQGALGSQHVSPPESPIPTPPVTHAADLADAVAARISQMRDQLLQELQSSFAGLRADQEFAWSEQTSILKSLSEELTSGGVIQPAIVSQPVTPPPPNSPPRLTQPSSPAAPATTDAMRRWEAIRQNFLQNDGRDLVETTERQAATTVEGITFGAPTATEWGGRTHQTQPAYVSGAATLAAAAQHAADFSDREFADVLPEPLDPAQIPESELRSVFVSRELLLAELIGRYRRRREHQQQLLSVEQLRGLNEQLPEDLRALVNASLNRIDELTRLSELELAFERARLSRERKQLEQSRFLLENHARQLGLSLNSDGSLSRSDDASGRPAGRRWLGKLGFGGTGGPGLSRDQTRRP